MRRSTFVLATVAVAATPFRASAQTLAPIRIAIFPGETAGQAYFAKELGYFAKNGLDATISEVRNGAAAAAAVVGGSIDIGFSNPLSIAQGHDRGVPFTVLAPAAESHFGKSTNTILVSSKTSTIRSGKDLDGQTVAVDGIGGMPELAVRNWIDKNGGDSSTVKFVELPYSEMVAGVNSGRVAAAAINTAYDPLVGKPNDPVHMLGAAYDSVGPKFDSSVWFAMVGWANKNPDVVRRFILTMKQAAQWATAHPHEAAVSVAKHTKQPLAEVEASPRVIYGTEMTPDMLQSVIDLGAKYGVLKSDFQARDMISALATK